ncbi:major facilitator superfamily domain-containing protein [Apodospora peruviana]|uniref:Major facilitator superfamily domain-containing protein n=1 Tax=Apodospora peruviana TaxID=516989 RepID=A0AAE0HTT5_9PEZI|nr:major facilitator superfamily domain-containing protein [Apodospora peruviana]
MASFVDDSAQVRQPLLQQEARTYNGTTTTTVTTTTLTRSETQNATIATVDLSFDKGDPSDNPMEWPDSFKWGIVLLLSMMAFVTTFTCISVVPLAGVIVDDLTPPPSLPAAAVVAADFTQQTTVAASHVLLVTIWELGEAAGPLLIAPLSELHGRYVVMNAANMLLIAATVLAATSTTVPQFVTARALTGLAVACNVLNPAIRGGAVSLVFLAPLIGGAIAPGIATMIADRFGSWRAVVWLAIALATTCELLFLTYFRETYKLAILRKKVVAAAAAAAEIDDNKQVVIKAVVDGEESDEPVLVSTGSELRKLRDAVLRPALVLCGSGVLMALSLLGSVAFTYFYIMSVTLPNVLQERYGLSSVATGWCFISFTLGSAISVFICNNSLDKIYIRMRDASKDGVGLPEYRLPLGVVGALCTPVAIAMYGWSAELELPLPFLLLSVLIMGTTVMLTVIPLMAYVVDAFGLYSASAMTGIIVTRCLMSTFLPLTTGPLIDNFGYGWGFSVFAAFSFCLAPISILILRYGAKWRQFSKYSREQ